MSSSVIDLLGGYFSEELIDARPIMHSSLHNGGAEGVERTRAEFRGLLRDRRLTHDEFYRGTSAWFDDDEKMYREFEDAYRFFFGEEPPAPLS